MTRITTVNSVYEIEAAGPRRFVVTKTSGKKIDGVFQELTDFWIDSWVAVEGKPAWLGRVLTSTKVVKIERDLP